MRVAILGGGHGCYAAAADLMLQGHNVTWWRRQHEAFEPLRQAATLGLTDPQGQHRVPLPTLCQDIGQAVHGAELLLLPTPAIAQDDIAKALAPHLTDGQVVFLAPGTFGSYTMAQQVRSAGNQARVAWAETGTLPYLARCRDAVSVNVSARAVRLPTGVYPAAQTDHAMAVIQRAYASVHPCGNALSGALMNAGPVIHPPLMIMNAAPLQHFERWDIHNEGTQPVVRAVTDALDQERIAVREALGYDAPHYPLADHYQNDRWMYGDAHRQLVKSGDWREHIDLFTHRYITEDVVLGLALLASTARWAGAQAPVAHGILAMVGAYLRQDLRHGPRTLEALGLANQSQAAVHAALEQGPQA
ncbi:MAG: NAD/NADP octopine/nopaline dehydrogenase family protein [Proteobacteria bacterium]|nr:NAD/NADP octopine/nopaline dehydrogenase family protein [Pseudomonadota bacterium]MDA0868044.1 NAD/NADP octopine/nopaline dehydrogenase family protein [Pseudomonadota bacterium]MDA1327335.1 NAD/NADP octopine/nopaline dehydrogenase family protein [Pseudomonadota bacterium]